MVKEKGSLRRSETDVNNSDSLTPFHPKARHHLTLIGKFNNCVLNE